MGSADAFRSIFCCEAEDSVRSPFSDNITSNSDKVVHDIEYSDSQFLRDFESVFTELTKHVCSEKDRIENSARIPSPAYLHNDLVLNNQQRSTHCREESTKSGCVSLGHEETSIIRSHDRDTNETGPIRTPNHLLRLDACLSP